MMLDSDLGLDGMFLPAFGDEYGVWALQNNSWHHLGNYQGYQAFDVPAADGFRISNANSLVDVEGNFMIGLRFSQSGDFRGSLQLISSPFGVPEPSAWIMMMLGFGLVGGMLRSNSHKSSIFDLK